MNTDEFEGGFNSDAGAAQSYAGQAPDDPDMELEGDMRRMEGGVQEIIGQVQDAIADAADTVSATAAKVGERARETYADVTIRVQRVADQVDPFVKAKPYAALGLAALGGLMLGLIYGGRGPKIVYIKPRM